MKVKKKNVAVKDVKGNSSRYYSLSIILTFLFGFFLRFANTPQRYGFDGDAIRDAIVAYEGAKTFAFPLAGPFSSTGPYTFGPWYYIILIFFSRIFPSPYIPWIVMGILSLFSILLMADIGRLLHDKKLGVILAAITAIAPIQISVGVGLSNISPVPFFSALSIWLTFKILKKELNHMLWYFIFGIALGIGINMHYQMVGLLLLPIFIWIYKGWKQFIIPLLIGAGLFVSFIPLLTFNLLTNWSTVNGIHEMYIAKERMYFPNSWKIYLFDFWIAHLKFLFVSSLAVNISVVFLFATACITNILKKKYAKELSMLLIIFLFNFLWLRFYWGERHDVYLYYLSPIMFIFLGYTLTWLYEMKYGKIIFALLTLITSWNMLTADISFIGTQPEHIAWEKEATRLSALYPYDNLTLYSCNAFYQPHKKTLLYLLRFNYQSGAPERKIALKGNDCFFPNKEGYEFKDYEIADKYGYQIYPKLFPELKDTNFNFIDITTASNSAITKAGWKLMTTKDVYNDTVNWWK